MKRILTILSVVLSLSFCGMAFASTKVAVVDMQQVLGNIPQVSSIQKKLEAQFKPRQEKISSMGKELRSDLDNYKKNSSVMTEESRNNLQQKIVKEEEAYQKAQISFNNDLSSAQNTAMTKIFSQIRNAARAIARKDDIDLVLIKSSILYSKSNMDITNSPLIQ